MTMKVASLVMLCLVFTGCSSSKQVEAEEHKSGLIDSRDNKMIVDHLDNALLYGGLGKRISIGLALLNEESVQEAAPGKYDVQGDDIFYTVSEYETKPFDEGQPEIHRKYLDIHYMVFGSECIGTTPLEGLTEEVPYDGQKDIAFYGQPASMSKLELKQGMFAIFWPNEPHMPGRIAEKSERVKKIVVKIRME